MIHDRVIVSGLSDVVVYGVSVPGCEGRAGMAAVAVNTDTLDLDTLDTD